jgi:hypothetical protein
MGNLTPEPRTDKNGKTSIRHVRPAGSSKSATSIPAPVVAPADPTKEVVDSAHKILTALEFPDVRELRANLAYLANSNMELFHEVVSHISRCDESEQAMWNELMTNRSLHEFDFMLKLHRERGTSPRSYDYVYREGLAMYPLATRLHPIDEFQSGKMYVNDIQRHVKEASSMTPKGMDSKDPSTVKAVMIQTRVEVLKQGGNRGQGISLKGLTPNITYLTENMEAVEPLVDELMRLRSTDRGLIEGLLAVRTPALREGVL